MPADAPTTTPRLAIRQVTKAFGGVPALRGVSLDAAPAELHALVGENGAGKSTLMKILAGQYSPDTGEIQLDGLPARFRSPHDALRCGIAMVHQEPLGFRELTAAENVFLGCEPGVGPCGWLDRRRQRLEAATLFNRLRLDLDPRSRLGDLSLAHQQGVEIARALAHRARILIMDEPTSAISEVEAGALFEVIRDLRRGGVTVLYISHRLEEVLDLADRITVLRDGALVLTAPASTLDASKLVSLMAGRAPASASDERAPGQSPRLDLERPADHERGSPGQETRPTGGGPGGRSGRSAEGAPVLEVHGLRRGRTFQDINFEIKRGEVVGLAGLVGAGRTETARAIYGLTPPDEGEIRVAGRPVRIASPDQALAYGIAMVTEDRRTDGIVPLLSLQQNLTLSSLDQCCVGPWVRAAQERAVAQEQMRVFEIKAASSDQPIQRLSGGNQQKALLARALLTRPRILILDEPTRGIDVAAKAEIHALVRRLASQGLAVLVISSELPEVLALSDRVLVMRHGRLVATRDARSASASDILHLALAG